MILEPNEGVNVSRFEGKRILITGGTSGMGLAGAQRIVREGGHVAITGLNEERLERACSLHPFPGLIRIMALKITLTRLHCLIWQKVLPGSGLSETVKHLTNLWG